MTSLIILILVGGAALVVVAAGLWLAPTTRASIKRLFGAGGGR
ncbi:hypothetical protein [Microbacterium sp. IEGM 1404]|nr:hypothetical protein [Microbacterium sp. IEGM 1404]MDI9892374.1 hypothetical protein [Microbacterium sp. IEGM 1404]